MIARSYTDVQFFSTTNSSFDLVTKIDIDYEPFAAAINDNTAVIGSTQGEMVTMVLFIFTKKIRMESGTKQCTVCPVAFVNQHLLVGLLLSMVM